MKLRILMLLALLATLLGLTACGGKPSSAAGITLVPYTSAQFGIRGVVPKGWDEVKPGQFQRIPGADPTLLGQVMFSDATIEQVIDHGQLPESVGSRETASLTWNLYNVELEWPNAGTLVWDGALTEGDTGVYMIVLVTLAAEHEPLYDAAFACG